MVPKIFHSFWDGPPMPKYIAEIFEKWKELHPDWELIVWNTETMLPLRHRNIFDEVEKFSPASNIWQFRTNIVRLETLLAVGGVWIDADLEPLKNIEPLIQGHEVWVAQEDEKFVNNGFIGAVPDHPYIRDLVDGIEPRVLALPKLRSNKQIGPHWLTKVRNEKHPYVHAVPRRFVYPFLYNELHKRYDDTDAYTRHHWHRRSTLEGVVPE